MYIRIIIMSKITHIVFSLVICAVILSPVLTFSETNAQLSFQINYVYRSAGKGDLKPLEHGETLYSGDHYKIIFTPGSDCHVYIFQVDSLGQIFQLFPMKQFKNVYLNNRNPVKAGLRYNLPSPHKAFKLDHKTGLERIYFIATRARIDELEHFKDLIANHTVSKPQEPKLNLTSKEPGPNNKAPIDGTPRKKLERFFKSRGFKVVKTGTPLKITWNKPDDLFTIIENRLNEFCDGCFHVLEFVHR